MKARLRTALGIAGALVALAAAYYFGYQAGLKDQGPQHRALVIVRKNQGSPGSFGQSYTWYDISKRGEAARLRADEQLLTAKGVDHYVTEGIVETSISAKPDPRHVNSHR